MRPVASRSGSCEQETGGYRSRAAAEASLEVDVTVSAGHAGSCLVWVRNGRV